MTGALEPARVALTDAGMLVDDCAYALAARTGSVADSRRLREGGGADERGGSGQGVPQVGQRPP